MTVCKSIIALPCTARELEAALHAACDHDGRWDAEINFAYARRDGKLLELQIESETKGETK